MPYRWQYEDAAGTVLATPGSTGADAEYRYQLDAEDWLTEHTSELLEAGVDQVTLLDCDEPVYEMSLHPPQP